MSGPKSWLDYFKDIKGTTDDGEPNPCQEQQQYDSQSSTEEASSDSSSEAESFRTDHGVDREDCSSESHLLSTRETTTASASSCCNCAQKLGELEKRVEILSKLMAKTSKEWGDALAYAEL
jgi:hypothetical protein